MHLRKIVFFLCLVLSSVGLNAQVITARLDFDRRDPRPDYVEYCGADGGIVTVGNMSRKSSRYQSVTKFDADFKKTWTKQVLQQNGRSSIDLLAALGEDIYVFISEY